MARYARRPAGPRRPNGPWKHGTVPVFGLIGGIGAGKSTVAAELAGRGAHVIDADAVGHALLQQRPVRDQVLDRFGPEVLDPTASTVEAPVIDRRALGSLVFASDLARRDLERLLHPAMRRTFVRAIDRAQRRGDVPAVVLDAAILLEAGWDDLCDAVLFVDTPEPARLQRLAARRGWDAEMLAVRERAQWPLDAKRQRSDHILSNNSSPEALREAVEPLWNEILRRPPYRTRSALDRRSPKPGSPTETRAASTGWSRGKPKKTGRGR
ncbi:hypothetical protein BH23PLA1_BH23PLA1_29320 [soil metagenome]